MNSKNKSISESSGYSLKGSFTRDLTTSKVWLLMELARIRPRVGTVYNLGSWYGNLAMYFNLLPLVRARKIINVEQQSQWLRQGARMLRLMGAQNVINMHQDANDLDYPQLDGNGVVINTSVNDMPGRDWYDHVPNNTLMIMQTRDHNPNRSDYENNDEILQAFPLRRVLYRGRLDLTDPETEYTRYMVIGIK
jgi:hypothetical protein